MVVTVFVSRYDLGDRFPKWEKELKDNLKKHYEDAVEGSTSNMIDVAYACTTNDDEFDSFKSAFLNAKGVLFGKFMLVICQVVG